MNDFGPLEKQRRSGKEAFHADGRPIDGMNVLDFWQWSFSDLISNANRGVLAEYIVGKALGCDSIGREEWAAFDLRTPSGITIEVKSAAYLQSWHQSRLSAITFGIQPTIGWDPLTAAYGAAPIRQAQLYVFAVLAHQIQSTLDALNLDQWTFYVLPTSVLNAQCPTQRTISLGGLKRLNPAEVRYESLSAAVQAAVSADR